MPSLITPVSSFCTHMRSLAHARISYRHILFPIFLISLIHALSLSVRALFSLDFFPRFVFPLSSSNARLIAYLSATKTEDDDHHSGKLRKGMTRRLTRLFTSQNPLIRNPTVRTHFRIYPSEFTYQNLPIRTYLLEPAHQNLPIRTNLLEPAHQSLLIISSPSEPPRQTPPIGTSPSGGASVMR